MKHVTRMVLSSVGKKYLMAITGLALFGFATGHLIGNLQLFLPHEWLFLGFNKYAHHLVSMGPALILIELVLISIAAVHVIIAININLQVLKARPSRYAMEVTKGGQSKSNLSSKHMLLLGVAIAAFLVLHLWQFKYGPYYETDLHGQKVRDIQRLVIETYTNPVWALVYVGFMIFLGFHLRHGIWSMFQSLGAMPGLYSKCCYTAGVAVAVLIAAGYIILPLWVLLDPFGDYADILEKARALDAAKLLEAVK